MKKLNQQNILKKIIIASFTIITLFVITGCQSQTSDTDKNEDTIINEHSIFLEKNFDTESLISTAQEKSYQIDKNKYGTSFTIYKNVTSLKVVELQFIPLNEAISVRYRARNYDFFKEKDEALSEYKKMITDLNLDLPDIILGREILLKVDDF